MLNKYKKIAIPLVLLVSLGIKTVDAVDSMSQQVISVILRPFGVSADQLFVWAIGLGAVLAFGVIVYGGVLWTISMGGEQKNEAKEWIKGAIYGLFLLIGAYLLLYTINPNLVGIQVRQ